jgi:hypothetical protein
MAWPMRRTVDLMYHANEGTAFTFYFCNLSSDKRAPLKSELAMFIIIIIAISIHPEIPVDVGAWLSMVLVSGYRRWFNLGEVDWTRYCSRLRFTCSQV